MPEVLEARDAYEQAQKDAIELRTRARVRLGYAVQQERKKTGSTQLDVAAQLGVVVEQVRRYEAAYRDWLAKHPGESLTP